VTDTRRSTGRAVSVWHAALGATTALPLQPPRLLTVAGFAALPENGDARYELQEGALVMSPSPLPEPRPALTACHRAGEFGYLDAPAATGVFAAEEPFRVRLELHQLLRSPGQR
jgi:hypothetical protein